MKENKDKESLKNLLSVFTNDYGTISITEDIISLYEKLQSYSDPVYEKERLLELYKKKTSYNKSIWSIFFKNEIENCLYINKKTEVDKKIYINIYEKLNEDISDEDLADFLENISFSRLPVIKDEKSKMIWEEIKKLVNLNRDYIKNKVKKELCSAIRYFSEDFEKQSAMANEFFAIYDSYSNIYSEKKALKNAMTFSDVERTALNILAEDIIGEAFKKTEAAKIISENYDEIFIDEYQDTNLLQDMIFRAVSKNEKNDRSSAGADHGFLSGGLQRLR